jgi:hypothetical protein
LATRQNLDRIASAYGEVLEETFSMRSSWMEAFLFIRTEMKQVASARRGAPVGLCGDKLRGLLEWIDTEATRGWEQTFPFRCKLTQGKDMGGSVKKAHRELIESIDPFICEWMQFAPPPPTSRISCGYLIHHPKFCHIVERHLNIFVALVHLFQLGKQLSIPEALLYLQKYVTNTDDESTTNIDKRRKRDKISPKVEVVHIPPANITTSDPSSLAKPIDMSWLPHHASYIMMPDTVRYFYAKVASANTLPKSPNQISEMIDPAPAFGISDWDDANGSVSVIPDALAVIRLLRVALAAKDHAILI